MATSVSYSMLLWDMPAVELSEFLLAVEINKPDEYGDHLLSVACHRLQVASVQLLLSHNADPNVRNAERDTPLLCAINVVGHNPGAAREIVSLLLDAGADIEMRGYMDKTPFLKACSRGDLEMLKLLVARGCNVHAVSTEDGDDSPLGAQDFASIHDVPSECVEYLHALLNA